MNGTFTEKWLLPVQRDPKWSLGKAEIPSPRPAGVPSTEAQNHRMVGVGRDLCGSSSPTPLSKQGHLEEAAISSTHIMGHGT